MNESLAFVIVT